jgi:hypothetical protein
MHVLQTATICMLLWPQQVISPSHAVFIPELHQLRFRAKGPLDLTRRAFCTYLNLTLCDSHPASAILQQSPRQFEALPVV